MAANPPLCQANLTLANTEKYFLHIDVGAEYIPVIFMFCFEVDSFHCYDCVHKVNPELKDVFTFWEKSENLTVYIFFWGPLLFIVYF